MGDAEAPLAGRTILVPRGGDWGERVAAQIRDLGGEAVIAELLRIAPPRDPAALADAATRWNRGDFAWLVITSANGADAFAEAGGRHRGGSRVAAVGPATAAALARHGIVPDLVPEKFSGSGVAEALLAAVASPASFLLPLSAIAEPTVERALRAAGHRVERVDAYRTVVHPAEPALVRRVAAGGVDAMLVTSSSAARAVAQSFGDPPPPPTTLLAAIGEPSAAALREAGLRADVVAATHTVPGLLSALAERYADLGPDAPAPDALASASDPRRSADRAEGDRA